jgi:hypothetical protein
MASVTNTDDAAPVSSSASIARSRARCRRRSAAVNIDAI